MMQTKQKTISPEEQLRNVANTMLKYSELKEPNKGRYSLSNGKNRSYTYIGSTDTLAHTGRTLAEAVLAYLKGELKEITDDGLPF
jgi:hypothetical protein